MARGREMRWDRRPGLLAGAAAMMLWAVPADAQERRRYNIPAGNAAQSVQKLAIESGVQVIAPNADLADITTNPVNGDYTPIEALRRMLANKGLEVAVRSDSTVVIRRASSVPGLPADEAPAPLAVKDIIVTGTRIERAGVDTVQAATVTDDEEIERRAYTNVIEALQDTPGFAPASNSQIGSSQGNLSVAQSFSNFFGLGSQRTLTLVNGRRFVSSNSVSGTGTTVAPGSQVDVNLIPVGLVDRIETVAIGGAPIYGSDAISGTVNFILKEDFDGVEFDAQASISERGDAANQTVRGLFGRNFMDGRGNIVLATEYVRQEGMKLSRRFPTLFLLPSGNVDRTDGIPSLVPRDQRFVLFNEGGLPFTGGPLPSEATYIRDASGQRLQFGPDGNLIPYNIGAMFPGSDSGPFPIVREGGDGVNPADHALLLSPNERILVNLIGNFDITDNINFFVEGSYAHTSGTKLSDLFQFAAPGVGGPALTLNVNNPFLTQQARSILVANGVTTFRLNRNLNDIVDRRPAKTELDVYRIVAGFKGDFRLWDQEWSWDAAYNFGRSENTSEFNQINQTRFLEAINVVSMGGSIVCSSGNAACAPLNLFGENAASQAAVDYVIDQGIGIGINELEEATANLSGRLPFGLAEPIAFAVGYAHRRESGSFQGNDILNGGLSLLNGAVAFPDAPERSFNTDEVYGETLIPLIDDDMGVPVIRAATFEGALRYVDHSIAGGDITWSAGARLQPRLGGIFDGLTLRGVYTRAIRSPSIVELFLNSTPVARLGNDLCAPSRVNSGPNPAVRLANCTAALAGVGAPPPAMFAPTTNVNSPFGVIGGNPDLDNEKADSWSIGLVWQPPAIPGLRLNVDYSEIKLTGAISRFTLGTAQAACYDSPAFPDEGACGAFRRLTAAEAAAQTAATGRPRVVGDIADGYLESFFNSAEIDFAGIIGEIDYNFDVPNIASSNEPGRIRLNVKAFYTDKFISQASGAAPRLDAAGTLGTPKWRVTGRIGYAFDPFDFDVQIVWNDKVVLDPALTPEDISFNNVPSYTLVNPSFGVILDDRFRLRFSVRNLFDKDVPFAGIVQRAYGVFDPIGRTYTVTASMKF